MDKHYLTKSQTQMGNSQYYKIDKRIENQQARAELAKEKKGSGGSHQSARKQFRSKK